MVVVAMWRREGKMRERGREREMWVSDPDCQERNKSNVASTRCADERS